jgi:NAD(P)-dependent dehydrogenase (short-subunit alcohol dehydrogenase family)
VARAKLTEEGLETTFALNHMAYFVVTQGLRERLVASASARVVSTASAAHQGARLDFDDLQLATSFSAMKAYGRSKLCNILFTRELARRLRGAGVTANCLHPGFVATRFADESGGLISRFAGLAKLLGISPRRRARKRSFISPLRPRSPRRRADNSTSAARLRRHGRRRTTGLRYRSGSAARR